MLDGIFFVPILHFDSIIAFASVSVSVSVCVLLLLVVTLYKIHRSVLGNR